MILREYLPETIKAMQSIDIQVLENHIEAVKQDKRVKVLKTRVIWDCFFHLLHTGRINYDEWKAKKEFTDINIQTLIFQAFKVAFPYINL